MGWGIGLLAKITMKHIRNATAIVAFVHVFLSIASPNKLKDTTTLAPVTDFDVQDVAFARKCKYLCEQQQFRRIRCDDEPILICQNMCLTLQNNLTYYSAIHGNSTILNACDSVCTSVQVVFCQGQLPYQLLCENIVRETKQLSPYKAIVKRIQISSDKRQTFFGAALLILLALSDLFVTISDCNIKFLYTQYLRGQFEGEGVASSGIKKILEVTQAPKFLMVVTKLAFEIQSLLFKSSCDQELEITLIFLFATWALFLLCNAGPRHFKLPTIKIEFESDHDCAKPFHDKTCEERLSESSGRDSKQDIKQLQPDSLLESSQLAHEEFPSRVASEVVEITTTPGKPLAAAPITRLSRFGFGLSKK